MAIYDDKGASSRGRWRALHSRPGNNYGERAPLKQVRVSISLWTATQCETRKTKSVLLAMTTKRRFESNVFLIARKLSSIYTQKIGVWRSLVAYLHGVQVVVGSNPATPTS